MPLTTRHTKDEDCTLGPSDACTGCGVLHGDACPTCRGRGYHREGCPVLARLHSIARTLSEALRERSVRKAGGR